ncbi:MgtC/SapB family protein [Sinimarinibacterium sp. CAU 1509]|uniref:MgtC/SapB family protein n=1 Tax=Sinimarinibacterium sp. CAU 1509 TaxID=2562283 RepID=UPI00146E2638|nr:MgtC/SapB family protein [Sinimarinibacterium sp. CAU 1509]
MDPLAALRIYLISLGIGLLIGLERERSHAQAAGVRTYALVALLGTTAAAITQYATTPWLIPASLISVIAIAIVSYLRDPQRATDPGYTSVIALLLCHLLGVLVWYGQTEMVVALAIATTLVLYFKPELHEFSDHVSRADMLSILQFAAVAFMLLPLLPDQGYGPWQVINPFRMGLMVALISGLSLAGYAVLKWFGGQRALALVGLLGGSVSSTATTLAFSRHVRAGTVTAQSAALVVLLANLTVLVRLGLIAAAIAPAVLSSLIPTLLCALAAGSVLPLLAHRRLKGTQITVTLDVRNPAELRTALTFALMFTGVMVLVAWLNEAVGDAGLYAVALVSGLTYVDAISLSALQMFRGERIEGSVVAATIAIAYASNLAFKFGVVASIGGRQMALIVAKGFGGVLAGLVIGYGLGLVIWT